jgi:hypothetical protein
MSKLMPRPSHRWCAQHHCGRGWYTAHPFAMACPYCGTEAKDASSGWPYACESGHQANDPGDCGECVTEKAEKAKRKQERRT